MKCWEIMFLPVDRNRSGGSVANISDNRVHFVADLIVKGVDVGGRTALDVDIAGRKDRLNSPNQLSSSDVTCQ